jgi:hypothetical protein
MFQALCKRRNIRIKYERFANAQTAAAVYNTLRHKPDDPIVNAADFVMDDKQVAAKERRKAELEFITNSVRNVPAKSPRKKFLEVRANVIKKLSDQGCENAEALFDMKWPNLKPKKDE